MSSSANSPTIRKSRRYLYWTVYGLFIAALMIVLSVAALGPELSALALRSTTGIGHPVEERDIWDCYYPEIRISGARDVSAGIDDRLDVLLLGGSVLQQVSEDLRYGLEAEFGDRVQVYALAAAAHTSRDSALKFSHLADRHFDLIIFYHAINDARMNCCPPEEFRHDYTHCPWYGAIERSLEAGRISFPDAVNERVELSTRMGEPRAQHLDFGGDLKTIEPFRGNVESVVIGAALQDSPVLLMTFASWIPPDYTRERFDAGELGYGGSGARVETWGRPEHVAAAIDAHNQVIRDVAAESPDVVLLDLEAKFPGGGALFLDPCHFTDEGVQTFVDLVLPVAVDVLRTHLDEPRADETGG